MVTDEMFERSETWWEPLGDEKLAFPHSHYDSALTY
jgi:hypothetical protein